MPRFMGVCAIYSQPKASDLFRSGSTIANCFISVSTIFTMLENEEESLSHVLCELVLIFPIKFIIILLVFSVRLG